MRGSALHLVHPPHTQTVIEQHVTYYRSFEFLREKKYTTHILTQWLNEVNSMQKAWSLYLL